MVLRRCLCVCRPFLCDRHGIVVVRHGQPISGARVPIRLARVPAHEHRVRLADGDHSRSRHRRLLARVRHTRRRLRPRARWCCSPQACFYRRHHRAIAHELAECERTWHPCRARLSRHADQGSGLTGLGVYDCGSGGRLRYRRFLQRSSRGSILGRLGCFLWGGAAAVAHQRCRKRHHRLAAPALDRYQRHRRPTVHETGLGICDCGSGRRFRFRHFLRPGSTGFVLGPP